MRLIAMLSCGCFLLLLPVYFSHATENVATSTSEERKAGTYVVWPGNSTEEIHSSCPGFLEPLDERGLRGGFTQQCESRLDQEFLEKIPMAMPIYVKDSSLTWRHVFDEPFVKRRIVLDTLGDSNCTTPSNQPDGDDLVDRCNAHMIADYAVLKYMCTGGLFRIRKFIEDGYEASRYLSTFERIFDRGSYWQKRWRQEYLYFHHAWIAAKCAGVPREALASLGVNEDAIELRREGSTPGEDHWWRIEQSFEAYQLIGVAAQLSGNLTRTEYGYEKKARRAWQLVDPVMAELMKVKDPGDYPSAAEEKAARLKHFIAASTWIERTQVDVSQDWLLKQIGDFSANELSQAAEDALEMMAKQGVE